MRLQIDGECCDVCNNGDEWTDVVCLPDEVAGLSVLFTVLYIWKRSSNKRMTKKAKLQTHYCICLH
jgi:hypothetical protein